MIQSGIEVKYREHLFLIEFVLTHLETADRKQVIDSLPFGIRSVRSVRTGSVMLVIANQTRRELGLEDPQVYDTEAAVVTAVEAMRKLIKKDRTSAAEK